MVISCRKTIRQLSQDVNYNIKHNVLAIRREIRDDRNHRYYSWDHCYLYFQKRESFTSDEAIDIASLHLAFYLASWGMYRGSSFLLWKDYKFLAPTVQELLEKEHKPLWSIDFDVLRPNDPEVDGVFALTENLKEKLRATSVRGPSSQKTGSDTLITKILLGTLGCTPAYDRLVRAGIRRINKFPQQFGRAGIPRIKFPQQFGRAGIPRIKFPQQFGRKSYAGVIGFYQRHNSEFKAAQKEIESQTGIVYPVMKLADMYFWNIGRKWDTANRRSK